MEELLQIFLEKRRQSIEMKPKMDQMAPHDFYLKVDMQRHKVVLRMWIERLLQWTFGTQASFQIEKIT